MSALSLLALAAMPAPPAPVWACTGIAPGRVPTEFVVLTNENGEPIDVRGLPGMLGSNQEKLLERLLQPWEPRLRMRTPNARYLISLSAFEAPDRARTVTIDEDLGSKYPYKNNVFEGMCVPSGTTEATTHPNAVDIKQKWAFWFVKLAGEGGKSLDATWTSICSIATDDKQVIQVSISVLWSLRKITILGSDLRSSRWQYGPLEFKGVPQASLFDPGVKGAPRPFGMSSFV